MKPQSVLEMIHSASKRFDSVRAYLEYRGDGPILKEIRSRIPTTEDGRRAFGISDREPSREPVHSEPDGSFGLNCRVWYADGYHWRREMTLPNGATDIIVCNGRRTLPIGGPPGSGLVRIHRTDGSLEMEDPAWLQVALDTYWTFYPFAPDEMAGISYELAALDLSVKDKVMFAGREAIPLVGTPGENWDCGWDPDPLSWGADEYEVLVDSERGVLLRCASRLGGKDFDALEVEEIHYDERFDDEVVTSLEPLSWGGESKA